MFAGYGVMCMHVTRPLQAEGRAAEQGMGAAASKRAQLHAAAAARRKGRSQAQEQPPDPLAKRQVGVGRQPG